MYESDATLQLNLRSARGQCGLTTSPPGLDFTLPLADLVWNIARTGPKDSCNDGDVLWRQLPIKPM